MIRPWLIFSLCIFQFNVFESLKQCLKVKFLSRGEKLNRIKYIASYYQLQLNTHHRYIRNRINFNLVNSVSIDDGEIVNALMILEEFDDEYLSRMKKGREAGKSPQMIEIERARELKAEGIKYERERLRSATKVISSVATETTLGIKAETGIRGLETLKSWVGGLSLSRGVLRVVDENNIEVAFDRWNDVSVYIKYNSSENGDAYMKPYEGGYDGIIFQPKLDDGVFRQFGDLPLNVFL